MARQERNSVDYFPFICKEGKAMFYIENKYGNDGFAVWVKLLRQLAVTSYHYLNLSNKTELMFLSAKCRVSEEVLISIIDDLTELGEFDSELWKENRIIWGQKFIDSIADAYKKRNNECISYEGLLTLLASLGIRKPPKGRSKGAGNTQSKVKKSKEEKSKGFTPPTLEEVKDYFKEKGYDPKAGERAFDYYDDLKWFDSQGNQVKSWKSKMNSVWFKDENKIKTNGQIANPKTNTNPYLEYMKPECR